MAQQFEDRRHAGRVLADRIEPLLAGRDALVLALPRGGVPVAYEVATRLGARLEVFLVRKLGTPGHEELAMGAIASGGTVHLNRSVIDAQGITEADIERVVDAERAELARREAAYRGGRPLPDLRARTIVIVDDGLATGSTMRAAIEAVGQHQPGHLVVAVPVGPAQTCAELSSIADEVVCAVIPSVLHAVGHWYANFTQTTDDEVAKLLGDIERPGRRAR